MLGHIVTVLQGERYVELGVDSSQVKEDDKVKLLCKYLSADAKAKVGEHHRTLGSALNALQDHYGNPRAIWAKVK